MSRVDHPSEHRPPGDEGGVPRVLLVEDQTPIIRLVRHFLGDQLHLDAVQIFDAALEQAKHCDYHLFLIDIRLPEDASGIDLLNALRALPRHAATPAVAVTAYALPGDREQILRRGFDAYVAKPFARSDLEAAIREVLCAH